MLIYFINILITLFGGFLGCGDVKLRHVWSNHVAQVFLELRMTFHLHLSSCLSSLGTRIRDVSQTLCSNSCSHCERAVVTKLLEPPSYRMSIPLRKQRR